MKLLLAFLLLPLCVFSQSPEDIRRWKSQSQNVTIIRDTWGVPHIYGKSDADAVFGLMYAQCEENFDRIERNYLEMMGRMGEVEGRQAFYKDLEMRLIYDEDGAKKDYEMSPQWMKKLLTAFADGINYYLSQHPEVKPMVLKKFEPWFPLMYTDGSIAPTQNGGLTQQDIRNFYPAPDNKTSYLDFEKRVQDHEYSGSNGFALSPSRTTSGNAMLYINPHVTFYFRSEVHMVSEEGLNAYGAVTWGQFFVYQGFNEHCGWMHTSSYADVADLFIEKTVTRNDSIYTLYDGKILPVEKKEIEIGWQENGKQMAMTVPMYRTIHGPVVGSRDGSWLSLKENNRSLASLIQSWVRTKAKGFDEYLKAMELKANNSNNTVFADKKGNIAYWHGNFVPKRNKGIDYGLPVDGSKAETNWQGLHKIEETVHIYNPSTGFIQNCNSTPFTASGVASPIAKNYPAYMAPDGQNFRGINAAELLDNKKKFSFEELISEVGYNRNMKGFDVLLPALFESALESKVKNSADVEEALHYLKNWDRTCTATSIAATLAIEWAYRILSQASPSPHPYENTNAIRQYQSAIENTKGEKMIVALAETMKDLETRFGNWRQAWGNVNRYQRTTGAFSDSLTSIPSGLAASTFGTLPSFVSRRYSGTDKRYGYNGNSFVACVEFGPRLKARTIITGGQYFNPDSKHYLDQASGFLEGKFKDIFYYREDVERNAEKRYQPGEE